MRRAAFMVVFGIVGMALTACGGDESPPNERDDAAVREVSVMMRDSAFEPTVIEVSRGEMVRLNLENGGALPHDFSIDSMPVERMAVTGGSSAGDHEGHGPEAAVHIALEAGDRGEIQFEATDAGEYVFYCDEPGHRDAGMHGILRVT